MAKPPAKKSGAAPKTSKRGTNKTGTSKIGSSKTGTPRASKKAGTAKKPGAAKRSAPARRAATTKASKSSAKRLTTGSGPNAAEIGTDFVKRVNLGQFKEIYERWYHPTAIESVEGDGQVWKGMKGIDRKNEWWMANHELHSCSADGPFVGATGFTVRYTMAFTPKGGPRVDMTEVGVYTVKNGRIVREEYMYHMG